MRTIRRSLLLTLLTVLALTATAQDVSVIISGGIAEGSVKQRMETAMSALLTEVNQACAQQRPLNLAGIDIIPSGRYSLEALWRNLHFACYESEVVERCITSTEGYTVRNIFIEVNPMVENYTEERERTLTIRLTRDGQIASVVLAASELIYDQVVRQGIDVTDFERRQTILNFVENYRSHYDEKDLKALEQVFSDDALIITGTVITRRMQGDGPQLKSEVVYKEQNKRQYLDGLKRVFSQNKYIKVTFSDINVVRHPTKTDYYGVTLHQRWQSGGDRSLSGYNDDGWVFLLWQFREGQPPVIYRRTWQQDKIIKLNGGDVININDFFIP